MNYHPKGMYTWDVWYLTHEETVHAFYLQRKRPDSTRTDREEDGIGHAISTNLVDWEELPNVLEPGEPGSLDDMNLFTGSTFEFEGKFYLYYTMRSSVDNGLTQRIGLATSTDLFHWTKFESNPVIVPDERWYHSIANPAQGGIVDCRDLVIVPSPIGVGFYGFYAARIQSDEMPGGAVIACVYSTDLISWEHLPPVFIPGKYTIIEVPDVFYLDGNGT
ncbi:family 43 glycosylhydrolase [Paenibacillus sp. N3.4]|uniref:family 43 glycosylhydrolase n=1 Tax=Paenibacillus sp. N3.4 TaxID=2603222 RepID=UPI0011C82EAD|nr:family 43 glycosylhydrolase [Paenibacillus sp. N3.4]TXK84474.1 family 43 glycosylhydrolase [Paenibacillus sp. N3.4]